MHGTTETAARRRSKSHRIPNRPPFECIALLLQGGGALGSYQAGVYEALAEGNLHPDWIAGISIGAINSAIIAGNPPAERVAKLRGFWEEITANPLLDWAGVLADLWLKGDFARGLFNQMSANLAMFAGAAGFFALREHVMASGSLPPGFPSAEIEGEFYWDGGLISNTPLQWVAEHGLGQDTLAFQVDLWSARGDLPRNLLEVATRQKEIQYSSRTRANTDHFKRVQRIRTAISSLLGKLPKELLDGDEVKTLKEFGSHKVYNIVHLIYHARNYEGQSKDYEFSRLSMEDHWRAGYQDAVRTLRHPEVLERPRSRDGIFVFDFHRDGRE